MSRASLEIEWNHKVPGGPGQNHRMTQRWADTLYQPTQWYPRVAVYDGPPFGAGAERHVRFNFATSRALLEQMADIKLAHVPYRGTGPALNDLLGGHVAVHMGPIPALIGMIRGGAVRAIGVTGPQRSPILPDMPTAAGSRLRCEQCETEIIVVKGTDEVVSCCGQPMAAREG